MSTKLVRYRYEYADICAVLSLLPAGGAIEVQPAGIVFTHGPIFGVFRPAGATRCTDQGQIE